MYNQNDIEKLFDFYDKNDKTKMICLDINLMCFNVYRELSLYFVILYNYLL